VKRCRVTPNLLNITLLSMGQSPAKLQGLASHNKKAYRKRKLDQIYVALMQT